MCGGLISQSHLGVFVIESHGRERKRERLLIISVGDQLSWRSSDGVGGGLTDHWFHPTPLSASTPPPSSLFPPSSLPPPPPPSLPPLLPPTFAKIREAQIKLLVLSLAMLTPANTSGGDAWSLSPGNDSWSSGGRVWTRC